MKLKKRVVVAELEGLINSLKACEVNDINNFIKSKYRTVPFLSGLKKINEQVPNHGKVSTKLIISSLADFKCQCCGLEANVWLGNIERVSTLKLGHKGEDKIVKLTIDHIIPSCHGGSDNLTNLWLMCYHCNTRKSSHIVCSNIKTKKLCFANKNQFMVGV